MPSRITSWLAYIVASAIPALMIAAAGVAIASTAEELIETRVLDSGFEPVLGAQPQRFFVVCTTRAGVTACKAFDLSARSREWL